MDISKNKRIHPQECTKHIINPHQYNSQQDKRGRKGQPFAPLLFAYTSEREKETITHKEIGQEDKQRQQEQKDKREDKKEDKKDKIGANTPQVI